MSGIVTQAGMFGGRRGGFDADAADYFARAEALGGSFDQTAINATYTEAYVKSAISDCAISLKAGLVWNKITELYLFTGVSFPGLMAKLKSSSIDVLINSGPFVAANYVAAGVGAGIKKEAADGRKIDTGVPISTMSVDNSSLGFYLTEGGGNGVSCFNNAFTRQIGCISNQVRFSGVTGVTFTFGDGFKFACRLGDNVVGWRNGGDKKTSVYTDLNAAVNGNLTLLSYANNTTTDVPVGNRYSAFIFGSGDYDDTEAANLSSAINTLMTALGCNVY